MILESDIEDALGQRLHGLSGLPRVVWENQDDNGKRPYMVVEVVRLPPRDATLNGDGTIQRGYMQVTVVSDLGKLSRWSVKAAQDVAAAFPMALKLDVTGGKVTINRPPFIGQGYRDKVSWRLPVQIHYQAS